MYKSGAPGGDGASGAASGGTSGGAAPGGEAGSEKPKDNVVDAEFVDVDEKK
jgi:hypothetical protein